MVDSLSPLPPINARITKTQVSEKDPHHQNNQQQHQDAKDEEIKDEVVIENLDQKEISSEENKKKPSPSLPHKIDIEV